MCIAIDPFGDWKRTGLAPSARVVEEARAAAPSAPAVPASLAGILRSGRQLLAAEPWGAG